MGKKLGEVHKKWLKPRAMKCGGGEKIKEYTPENRPPPDTVNFAAIECDEDQERWDEVNDKTITYLYPARVLIEQEERQEREHIEEREGRESRPRSWNQRPD